MHTQNTDVRDGGFHGQVPAGGKCGSCGNIPGQQDVNGQLHMLAKQRRRADCLRIRQRFVYSALTTRGHSEECIPASRPTSLPAAAGALILICENFTTSFVVRKAIPQILWKFTQDFSMLFSCHRHITVRQTAVKTLLHRPMAEAIAEAHPVI